MRGRTSPWPPTSSSRAKGCATKPRWTPTRASPAPPWPATTLKAHSVAYGKGETLEGAPIDGAVILEFPTIEAAKAWYDSDAYRAAREHRFKGADYRAFITEGL